MAVDGSGESKEVEVRTVVSTDLRFVVLGLFMVLLSLIANFEIGDLVIKGGVHFAALAAIFFFWPLFRRILERGGSAEFAGLKFKVDSLKEQADELERHSAEHIALDIEALRSDIEELRATIPSPADTTETRDPQNAEAKLMSLIENYRAHRDIDDWKARVAIDKRLARGDGRPPIEQLQSVLNAAPDDPETAMAIAVSLGVVRRSEDDAKAAEMLAKLMNSRYERVRFRASRSIERRARRSDLTSTAREIMLANVREAIASEKPVPVHNAMSAALDALSANS